MAAPIQIDLGSDTVTRPTAEMRRYMCMAEVGDEQKQEDPTTNRLIEMVSALLGKEDALFVPSGTMCNQIAFRVFCRLGDEIIMDSTAHARHYESGGAAALSGATIYPLEGANGIFSASQLEEALRPIDNHCSRSRLVVLEQTSNLGGGSIWPFQKIQEISAKARQHGIALHMDGARLFNAVVATAIPAKTYAAEVDSIWIDFSKGLGAPVGAALAGSKAFIQEAWRWKHQFGGAMRQSGIIAAAAIYALEHNIERLAEDHANAKFLAQGLSQIPGIQVDPAETNIVYFDAIQAGFNAKEFCEAMSAEGVRFSRPINKKIRAVTHLDVSRSKIERVLEIVQKVMTQNKG